MKDYQQLDRLQKAEEVKQYRACRIYRHDTAVYLNALRTDNKDVIANYEQFGDSARPIIENKRYHDQACEFGFVDWSLNEYGWFSQPKFLDTEKFEFVHKKGWAIFNSVEIGRSPNGRWVYGIWWSANTSGYGSGMSVWNTHYPTRKECLCAGLTHLMAAHQPHIEKCQESKKVYREVKQLYDEITGQRGIQLDLFAIA